MFAERQNRCSYSLDLPYRNLSHIDRTMENIKITESTVEQLILLHTRRRQNLSYHDLKGQNLHQTKKIQLWTEKQKPKATERAVIPLGKAVINFSLQDQHVLDKGLEEYKNTNGYKHYSSENEDHFPKKHYLNDIRILKQAIEKADCVSSNPLPVDKDIKHPGSEINGRFPARPMGIYLTSLRHRAKAHRKGLSCYSVPSPVQKVSRSMSSETCSFSPKLHSCPKKLQRCVSDLPRYRHNDTKDNAATSEHTGGHAVTTPKSVWQEDTAKLKDIRSKDNNVSESKSRHNSLNLLLKKSTSRDSPLEIPSDMAQEIRTEKSHSNENENTTLFQTRNQLSSTDQKRGEDRHDRNVSSTNDALTTHQQNATDKAISEACKSKSHHGISILTNDGQYMENRNFFSPSATTKRYVVKSKRRLAIRDQTFMDNLDDKDNRETDRRPLTEKTLFDDVKMSVVRTRRWVLTAKWIQEGGGAGCYRI